MTEVTRILSQIEEGDGQAADDLLSVWLVLSAAPKPTTSGRGASNRCLRKAGYARVYWQATVIRPQGLHELRRQLEAGSRINFHHG
jgi:hypothetical protein